MFLFLHLVCLHDIENAVKNNPIIVLFNYVSVFITCISNNKLQVSGKLVELRIITQPYSAVYWGYFRLLVFGNLLTKRIKISSFSYSVVIFASQFPTYSLVFMLTLPISHV